MGLACLRYWTQLWEVSASTFLQAVKVLNKCFAFQHISLSVQHGIIHKLAEKLPHPLVKVVNKELEHYCHQ